MGVVPLTLCTTTLKTQLFSNKNASKLDPYNKGCPKFGLLQSNSEI